MGKVEWPEAAGDALIEIYEYIARDSPQAARKLVERLIAAGEQIRKFPNSGRIVPEYGEHDYREILVANFRVQYRTGTNLIRIVTVIHGRRLLRPGHE